MITDRRFEMQEGIMSKYSGEHVGKLKKALTLSNNNKNNCAKIGQK